MLGHAQKQARHELWNYGTCFEVGFPLHTVLTIFLVFLFDFDKIFSKTTYYLVFSRVKIKEIYICDMFHKEFGPFGYATNQEKNQLYF